MKQIAIAIVGVLVVFVLYLPSTWLAGLVAADIWDLFLTPEFGVPAPRWYVFSAASLLLMTIRPNAIPTSFKNEKTGDVLKDGRNPFLVMFLPLIIAASSWILAHLLHWVVT